MNRSRTPLRTCFAGSWRRQPTPSCLPFQESGRSTSTRRTLEMKEDNGDALHAGFARVRDNHGCAGADAVSIEDFAAQLEINLFALEQEINTRSYRPLPLLEILVDKGD